MTIQTAKHDREFFIIPTFGIIDRRPYYGYRVFSLAFAWGFWGVAFTFGARRIDEE